MVLVLWWVVALTSYIQMADYIQTRNLIMARKLESTNHAPKHDILSELRRVRSCWPRIMRSTARAISWSLRHIWAQVVKELVITVNAHNERV